jgi:hypothetical protein
MARANQGRAGVSHIRPEHVCNQQLQEVREDAACSKSEGEETIRQCRQKQGKGRCCERPEELNNG